MKIRRSLFYFGSNHSVKAELHSKEHHDHGPQRSEYLISK